MDLLLLLVMENSTRYGRTSLPHFPASKSRRSGYEPSDTETDWQDSPWRDRNETNGPLRSELPRTPFDPLPKISPMRPSRRHSSKIEYDASSSIKASGTSPTRRRHSKSPYKPHKGEAGSNIRRNVSPLSKSERWRNISPYELAKEHNAILEIETMSSNRKQNHRMHDKHTSSEVKGADSQLAEVSRTSERPNSSHRSASAPRTKAAEKDRQINYGRLEQRSERTPSPLAKSTARKQIESSPKKGPSVSEINVMVATERLARGGVRDFSKFDSTDSNLPGDIFFSHDYTALALQKNVLQKNNVFESRFPSNPNPNTITKRNLATNQSRGNDIFYQNTQGNLSSTVLSGTAPSSAVSRESSGRVSTESSKMSDASGSLKKFTANRRKSHSDAWFACMRKGPCKTRKSPEKRDVDETSFIQKALVVENLRQFWADKHRPASLNGFTLHKQEAQLLKQLVSSDICPHVLFKGPSGSGKKALTMALLREIYGDASWNISHELRSFHVQEKRPMQVVVPLTSSAHHVELNVNLEPYARHALMAIVKQIRSNCEITPEVSNVDFKADYKVLVLYEVDKAAENIQYLIKWTMDCYTDACQLIMCCEDDVDVLESVKNRCKVIKLEAPVTHEIMEVLIQIARKEDFDLPMSFAAKIATKSKQDLRKAIMALEACKAHNYPFLDDQPIPLGWEEVLVELAAEVLVDPSPNRLFYLRGKIQKLLVDFVHPKLILQKLVEQFLKGTDASQKRDLYYWHAYYDKRLPAGTSALLKLEEFVAKFMSIRRKSMGNRQYT